MDNDQEIKSIKNKVYLIIQLNEIINITLPIPLLYNEHYTVNK